MGAFAWDATTGRPLSKFPRLIDWPEGGICAIAYSPDGSMFATSTYSAAPVRRIQLWDAGTNRELPVAKRGEVTARIQELFFSPDGKTLAGRPADAGPAYLWAIPSGKLIARLHHAKAGDQRGSNDDPSVGWMAYAPDGQYLYTVATQQLFVWDAVTGQRKRTIPLPDGAREVGHALSSDGTIIASEARGHICFTDVASGQEAKRITAGRHYTSLVFADHSTVLVGRTQNRVDFYDVPSGERRLSFEDPVVRRGGTLYANAAGTRVALTSQWSRRLRIWDATTGQELSDAADSAQTVIALGVTADGKTVLAAGVMPEPRVRRWALRDGKPLPDSRAELPADPKYGVRRDTIFSPDGRFVAWNGWEQSPLKEKDRVILHGPDGKPVAEKVPPPHCRIEIVDAVTGAVVRRLEKTFYSKSMVTAWSPDGKTIAADVFDRSVQLWDVATGAPRCRVGQGTGEAFGMAFSPDGQMLAVAYSRPPAVVMWDTTTGASRRSFSLAEVGDKNSPTLTCNVSTRLAIAPDGSSLVFAVGREVHRWDLKTGAELPSLAGPPGDINCCVFSRDGRLLLAGCSDGSVRAWNSTTGRRAFHTAGHDHPISAMTIAPDGKSLITGSTDGTILIWDLASR